ncbi:hypothetical protein [Paenibacillus polymyxa]|uniref:Uncharacterized protein n=1 Tax=Paenibacillus polymyxa (strain SC2) TaxID=886882 RepID=E3EL05_PAEPS|nr:hypothetical protein [Paenibacillus polymyxa]ADO59567.1 hypothetical protein PPSC2_27260 [Paenibacillus polymyxa SC2]WPQ59603.1 hypothetical protein SKN87_28480 [Paenibacillus polymyxa]
MKELELMLLNMWSECGIEEIYKYKNRIKAFKEPLLNIELFYDLTYRLFSDVEDIANHEDSCPKNYKLSVNALIQSRSRA